MNNLISKIDFPKDVSFEEKLNLIKSNVNIGDLIILHFEGSAEWHEHAPPQDITRDAVGYYHGFNYTLEQVILGVSNRDNGPAEYVPQTGYHIRNLIEIYNLHRIDPNPLSEDDLEDLKSALANPHHYLGETLI